MKNNKGIEYISIEEFKALSNRDKANYINVILAEYGLTKTETLKVFYYKNTETCNNLYSSVLPYIEKDENITYELLGILNKKFNPDPIVEVTKEEVVLFNDEIPTIKYKNLYDKGYILRKHTDGSAGYDLYLDNCISDEKIGLSQNIINLNSGQCKKYGTGIAVEIPEGYVGLVILRSSIFGVNNELVLANGTGIIDSDYRGEIILHIFNTGHNHVFGPKIGDRIAQILFVPVPSFNVVEVDELSLTSRNTDGFGSTGV